MNKILVMLISLSFISVCSFGQIKLKQITKKHKNPTIIEKYYVVKNNTSIKHGIYEKFDSHSKLIERGFYKNNEKDSLWIEYQLGSKGIKSKGSFKNDREIGLWEFYDYKDRLNYSYNFDENKVIDYHWYENSDSINVRINGVWDKRKVDSPPLSLRNDYRQTIARNLRYPESAARNNISGKVIIAVTINVNGEITDYRIEKSVNEALDKEALRVVKLINIKWIPAYIQNEAYESEIMIPAIFMLQ
jgi:TonB family protein